MSNNFFQEFWLNVAPFFMVLLFIVLFIMAVKFYLRLMKYLKLKIDQIKNERTE
jgi:di/tricarboxylate transporter